jgi:formaldehyde-activating enzyme involved in methanogenesis
MVPVAVSKRPVAVTMRKIMAIPLCTYKDALCVTGVIQSSIWKAVAEFVADGVAQIDQGVPS